MAVHGFRKLSLSFGLLSSLLLPLAASAEEAKGTEPQGLTTAAQILDKVLEKYKTAGSFSAEAELSDTSNTQNANCQAEKTAKFWFKRPGLLRVDWTSRMPFTSKLDQRYAIFVRGGQPYTFQAYGSLPMTYEKAASLEMAVAAHTGISSRLAATVPSLLLGKSYVQVYPWTRGDDVQMDGQDCFTLNSISKSTGTITTQWIIAKNSFALLQTKEATQMSSEEVKQMMEQTEKILGKKSSVAAFMQGQAYPGIDNEFTSHYKNVVWDPAFKGADFDYPVPAEAKLTTQEETMAKYGKFLGAAESPTPTSTVK